MTRIPIDEEAIKREQEYEQEQKKLKNRIKRSFEKSIFYAFIVEFIIDLIVMNFFISCFGAVAEAFLPLSGFVLICLFEYVWTKRRWYWKEKPCKYHRYFSYVPIVAYITLFTVMLTAVKGSILSEKLFSAMLIFIFPFYPIYIVIAIMGYMPVFYAGVLCAYLIKALTYALCDKKKKQALALAAYCAVLSAFCVFVYFNGPSVKYGKQQGHGFKYMHGYSSTDFTGYNVYDGEKLVSLDHESNFIIENKKDMPVLDGAEACYPLYCAVAKAVYRDIDKIEKAKADEYESVNGEIVQFTNTVRAYERLADGKADLVFGARPSAKQKYYAKQNNEQIVSVPIAKEAFVFFVEPDNPVDGLTTQQVKDIYSGKIKNWKEVGGKNQKIVAFQRPLNSGSQTMMLYFMGNTPLKEPLSYEVETGMGGVVENVAQYTNEKGAMGYSFRYFVEELQSENSVKLLKIDGIAPTLENIENGTYPLCVDLVCAKLKSNNKENVQKMLEFLLSDDGKYIIRKTGYAPVKNTEIIQIEE